MKKYDRLRAKLILDTFPLVNEWFYVKNFNEENCKYLLSHKYYIIHLPNEAQVGGGILTSQLFTNSATNLA